MTDRPLKYTTATGELHRLYGTDMSGRHICYMGLSCSLLQQQKNRVRRSTGDKRLKIVDDGPIAVGGWKFNGTQADPELQTAEFRREWILHQRWAYKFSTRVPGILCCSSQGLWNLRLSRRRLNSRCRIRCCNGFKLSPRGDFDRPCF